MAIRLLQVGPPTRRELAPGHAPLIFDREVLRAPAHKLFKHKHTSLRVAKPTLNSTTCTLTFSLPTGTPHTVSTEHNRDSQRSLEQSNMVITSKG
jgi:hypothetical protein